MLWGPIEPSESLQTRLRLDFGLRPAILSFNEWAVPGLGGAFFVRQLTWGCIGITLAGELGKPLMAAQIAEAIEAFACWTALKRSSDYEKDDRVQGKRKFSALDRISFDAISKGGAYVTVPFRRAATAALPGLGFCEKAESRFNALKLARPGIALAETALANRNVSSFLRGWIAEPAKPCQRVPDEIKQALLPGATTPGEGALVGTQLLSNPKRALLAKLVEDSDAALASLQTSSGQSDFLAHVQDAGHRAQLDACFAFERVRHAALRAAQALANGIQASAQPWPDLAQAEDVQREFALLEQCCATLAAKLAGLPDVPVEIQAFCHEQHGKGTLVERIKALAARVPLVFSVLEQRLEQGMGYTTDLVAADANEAAEGEERLDGVMVPKPLLRLKRLHQEVQEVAAEARHAA